LPQRTKVCSALVYFFVALCGRRKGKSVFSAL